MSRVRTCDTAAELAVRRALHRMGLRFRLHRNDLPGKPDLVLPRFRLAVFVHGCFWHQHPGCRRARRPATNIDFWNRKLDCNTERDRLVVGALAERGWRTMVVWECETRDAGNLREVLWDRIALTTGAAPPHRDC